MKSRSLRPTGSMESFETDGDEVAFQRRSAPDVSTVGQATQAVARLVAKVDDLIEVPILGRVTAGLPIFVEENVLDTFRVDPSMVRGHRNVFGLRVVGESMIEAGILDGDYVFVRPGPHARRGEIVVAMIGGEATVKYFYPERDYVQFVPANAAMAPILVRAVDFRDTTLLGTVVGVYRKLSN